MLSITVALQRLASYCKIEFKIRDDSTSNGNIKHSVRQTETDSVFQKFIIMYYNKFNDEKCIVWCKQSNRQFQIQLLGLYLSSHFKGLQRMCHETPVQNTVEECIGASGQAPTVGNET